MLMSGKFCYEFYFILWHIVVVTKLGRRKKEGVAQVPQLIFGGPPEKSFVDFHT